MLHVITRLIPFAALGVGVYMLVLRRWVVRWGATDEEARRTLPGDELMPDATLRITRAISIRATPAQVWPWLVQIGFGRAGWYSYDLLDNLGRPSARAILPQYQALAAGDVVPLARVGGRIFGFRVAHLVAPEALTLYLPGKCVWTFALCPMASGHMRLITRFHYAFSWRSPLLLADLVFEPGDFVMMRKMLHGIRQRAESYSGTG